MDEKELAKLGKKLVEYCDKYFIPRKHLFEILNDQKVTPMIRGKATEFNAYELLRSLLNENEWSVQKLNLSAQPGSPDQDISITHKRTGIILKVESKNAVRGSMTSGARCRISKKPHFKVKCHRSRSNVKLADTTNDRYAQDVFDVIITNPLNALYVGNTVGEDFEIIEEEKITEIIKKYYVVSTEEELLNAASIDWRFVIPPDIAIDGFIPRTPTVLLKKDPNWLPIRSIEPKLLEIIKSRVKIKSKR
jgi:hypothetical protein